MSRKGGRHVTGEYGCTFIPSLVMNKDKRDTRMVTKFFYTRSEYEKENALLTKVRFADPAQLIMKTTLPTDVDTKKINIDRIFEPRRSDRPGEFEENGANCKNVPQNPIEAKQYFKNMFFIQYPYSGISLNELLTTSPITVETSNNIIIGLGNLLKQLKRINMRGFFHKDIHPGNITYSEVDKTCYLIDFGMFEKIDSIDRTTCFYDLLQFLAAVADVATAIETNQRQKKPPKISADKMRVLNLFNTVTYGQLRDIITSIVGSEPSADDSMVCSDKYNEIILQFDKFVNDYTKLQGGYTLKRSHKLLRKTLRRRKMRGNMH